MARTRTTELSLLQDLTQVDPSILLPQKVVYMEEWVHKAHDLLLQYGFTKALLPTAVQHANVAVREGLNELLALSDVRRGLACRVIRDCRVSFCACVVVNNIHRVCAITASANQSIHPRTPTLALRRQRAQVPFLIFSAGIADVIEEVCAQQLRHPLPGNVHIVSNHMLFEKGNGEGDGGDKLVGFTEPVFHVFNKRCVFLFPLVRSACMWPNTSQPSQPP